VEQGKRKRRKKGQEMKNIYERGKKKQGIEVKRKQSGKTRENEAVVIFKLLILSTFYN
jgi:ribosomal protein L25 (general stress protein Ctc)